MFVLWLFLCVLILLGLVILKIAGLSTLIGKPFVLIEQLTGEWQHALSQLASTFLPVPSIPQEQFGIQEQMDILYSRLLYFTLSVLFIAGEVYNTLLSLPALSHQQSSLPPLPGMFELAASVLFIIPPALFGMVLLEVTGFVTFGEGLFPTKLSPWQKGVLCVYAAACLIISVVVISSSWQFRAVYLDPVERESIDPQALSAMAEYVLHGLGLLAALSSILIIQALRIGFGSVIAVCLYIVSLGLLFVSSLARLIARFLEWISLYFSHNILSPYDQPGEPIKQVRGVGRARGNRLIEASQEESAMAYPLLLDREELMKTHKIGSIVFAGQLGSDLFDAFAKTARVLHGSDVLLASGGFHRPLQAERFNLQGTEDIAPSLEDIQSLLALQMNASDAIVYPELLSRMAAYLIRVYGERRLKVASAPVLIVLDCRILVYALDMLRSIKRAMPFSSLLVVTAISGSDLGDAAVKEGLSLCQDLWQEGIIETTLVVDPNKSPFRAQQDKQTMYRFLSHGLLCLLVGKMQTPVNNLSIGEVLTQLHTSSAFTTISFASAPIEPGRLPSRYRWRTLLPGGGKAKIGTCDLGLTLTTLKELVSQVIDPLHAKHLPTRSLNASVNPQLSAFVLCAVPITQQEEEKLTEVKKALDWYTETRYPNVCSLLARSNGLPYANQLPSAYLAQAYCFYPVHKGVFTSALTLESPKEALVLPEAYSSHTPNGKEGEGGEILVPFPVASGHKDMNNGAGDPSRESTSSTKSAPTGKKRGRPKKQPIKGA